MADDIAARMKYLGIQQADIIVIRWAAGCLQLP